MTSVTRHRFVGLAFAALTRVIVAGQLVVTPAGAHVGGTVAHLWSKHIRPLADDRYVRAAQVRTGYVSCPASAFTATASGTSYRIVQDITGMRLEITSGVNTPLACNAAVPHGATVTAIRFTVFDNSATKIVSCVFARQAFLGGLEFMADQSTTGEMNQPGPTQLLDTTITDPTVDDNNFAYSVLCQLGGTGTDIGLYGSSIEYTITGTG